MGFYVWSLFGYSVFCVFQVLQLSCWGKRELVDLQMNYDSYCSVAPPRDVVGWYVRYFDHTRLFLNPLTS